MLGSMVFCVKKYTFLGLTQVCKHENPFLYSAGCLVHDNSRAGYSFTKMCRFSHFHLDATKPFQPKVSTSECKFGRCSYNFCLYELPLIPWHTAYVNA